MHEEIIIAFEYALTYLEEKIYVLEHTLKQGHNLPEQEEMLINKLNQYKIDYKRLNDIVSEDK